MADRTAILVERHVTFAAVTIHDLKTCTYLRFLGQDTVGSGINLPMLIFLTLTSNVRFILIIIAFKDLFKRINFSTCDSFLKLVIGVAM